MELALTAAARILPDHLLLRQGCRQSRTGSAWFVHIRSMFNAVDVQGVLFDIQGEQHTVVATACGAQAQEFICEGFAEAAGIIGQGAGDEFDDRGGSLLR